MAAKLEKTSEKGIYKRGSRYAVIYRDPDGRQRQESARTLNEARRIKRARSSSVDDGSYQPQQRQKFTDYAREWIIRYQGNGRRGFTEDTRDEYKRDLERYAIPFFGRHRLEQITSRHVAEFVAWLIDEDEQGRRRAEEYREAAAQRRGVPARTLELKVKPVRLADGSVRRILAPVRSCLASAKREDMIRHNPSVGAVLPARDAQHRIELDEDDLEDEEQNVKALTTDQLATLLALAPARHELLWRLLAATGLRIGEALALRWGDLAIDVEQLGDAIVPLEPPAVKVRRSLRHGRFKPPKSKYGRRAVPIDLELMSALRSAHEITEHPGERDLVFCTGDGRPLDYSNLLRVFKPVAAEVGAPWAAFHTLRHTCATRLFAAGRNAVQVQRWLGHHSATFTLARYVHLLDDDIGVALALPSLTAGCQQACQPDHTAPTDSDPHSIPADAVQAGL
jgi:integrase